ncbi:hypothetical protein KSP40_PGU000850 [Platanthera guangdongensis]|uniref:Uncharacterized protein n=1 Tax=Platanthera guangdongensis TaxID=2320717 RepID=A0ABR2M9Z2_9ASPA
MFMTATTVPNGALNDESRISEPRASLVICPVPLWELLSSISQLIKQGISATLKALFGNSLKLSRLLIKMSSLDSLYVKALDIFETGGTLGVSKDSLDSLPLLKIASENIVGCFRETMACSVSLQDAKLSTLSSYVFDIAKLQADLDFITEENEILLKNRTTYQLNSSCFKIMNEEDFSPASDAVAGDGVNAKVKICMKRKSSWGCSGETKR